MVKCYCRTLGSKKVPLTRLGTNLSDMRVADKRKLACAGCKRVFVQIPSDEVRLGEGVVS